MKYCSFCHFPLQKNARFCSVCGRDVPKKKKGLSGCIVPLLALFLFFVLLFSALPFLRDTLLSLPFRSLPVKIPVQETQKILKTPIKVSPEYTKEASLPDFALRPYLQLLTKEERENFASLYQSVMNHQEECIFPNPMKVEDISSLYLLLYCECPEVIHLALDGSQTLYYDGKGEVHRMKLSYTMDRATFLVYTSACKDKINSWKMQTQAFSDWEKERFVYDAITNECSYDMEAPYAASAAGALVDGRAKCDGIAHAMQWAMQEMGISCTCVMGKEEGEEIGHCWNNIRLAGQNYALDVTMDVSEKGMRHQKLYPCFNVPNEALTHVYHLDPFHTRFAPPETVSSYDFSYHGKNGTRFEEGQPWEETVLALSQKACKEKGTFGVQFASAEEFSSFCEVFPSLIEKWVYKGWVKGGTWQYWIEEQTCTFGFSAGT